MSHQRRYSSQEKLSWPVARVEARDLTSIKSFAPDFASLMRFRAFIFINGQIGDNATIRYMDDALSRSMDIEMQIGLLIDRLDLWLRVI